MKKTLFRAILTLFLTLSLFLGNSVSANAADKVISTATIESLPSMNFGGAIADAKATFCDLSEGCIADSHWYIWNASANDGNGEWEEIHEGTFSETDIYYLCITFQAAEGYTFSETGLEVLYADNLEQGNVWSTYDDNGNEIYHCDMSAKSFATAIYEIAITTPEVVAGNTATLEDIVFYSGDEIIADENFEIEAKWICETDNYEDVTGKTFENDHSYQFQLCIKPLSKYYFFNELNIIHNGADGELSYDVAPTHYDFFYNKSLLTPLEKVELAGLPAIKTGETMVNSLEKITNLDDLNCEIYVTWWDENGEDTTDQVMNADHVYTMQIEINAFGNIALSEDFAFVIDGTEYKATTIDEYNEQPLQAWLELEYDFSGDASAGDLEDSDISSTDDVTDTESDTTTSNTASETGNSSMIILLGALAVICIGTIVFICKKQKNV